MEQKPESKMGSKRSFGAAFIKFLAYGGWILILILAVVIMVLVSK
jgi:hypothetical protein